MNLLLMPHIKMLHEKLKHDSGWRWDDDDKEVSEEDLKCLQNSNSAN
jgi:hypothetical protein